MPGNHQMFKIFKIMSKSVKKTVFWILKPRFQRERAESRNSDREGPRLSGVYLHFVQLLILFELQLAKVKLSETLQFAVGFSKESLYSRYW